MPRASLQMSYSFCGRMGYVSRLSATNREFWLNFRRFLPVAQQQDLVFSAATTEPAESFLPRSMRSALVTQRRGWLSVRRLRLAALFLLVCLSYIGFLAMSTHILDEQNKTRGGVQGPIRTVQQVSHEDLKSVCSYTIQSRREVVDENGEDMCV